MKKIVGCILCLLMLCGSVFAVPAHAESTANSYISISHEKATIGETITVSVNVVGDGVNMGSVMGELSYHSSVVEFVSAQNANGSSGTVTLSAYDATNTSNSMMITMTFEAIGTGTTYFTFTPSEIMDVDENTLSCTEAGVKLQVVSEDLSDNANLSAIRLSNGSLSPSFAADTTEYTVNVSSSVNEVVISATAAESDADVSISGSDELDSNRTKRTITVTAPDGETTKTYSVTIVRQAAASTAASSQAASSEDASEDTSSTISEADQDDLAVTIHDKQYTIVQLLEEDVIPDGFEKSTRYYNNIECEVAYNKDADLVMFYMMDEEDNTFYYLYNEESKEFYPYTSLDTQPVSLLLLDKPVSVEIPSEFVQSSLEINGATVNAWKMEYEDYTGYYLVYGMASDGETGLYLYDSKQATVQRFVKFTQTIKQQDQSVVTLNSYYLIAIIALAVICIVLFIIIVVLCKKHREYKF